MFSTFTANLPENRDLNGESKSDMLGEISLLFFRLYIEDAKFENFEKLMRTYMMYDKTM